MLSIDISTRLLVEASRATVWSTGLGLWLFGQGGWGSSQDRRCAHRANVNLTCVVHFWQVHMSLEGYDPEEVHHEPGTHKTARAGFWPWLEPFSVRKYVKPFKLFLSCSAGSHVAGGVRPRGSSPYSPPIFHFMYMYTYVCIYIYISI